MFVRRGKVKVFLLQSVVCLLVIVISINILISSLAETGKNAVADDLTGIAGYKQGVDCQRELERYNSRQEFLRLKMAERKAGAPGRWNEAVWYSVQGWDKKSGQCGSGVFDVSGAWVTTTVDHSGVVGVHTSLALDTADKAHISYYDGTHGDLKYATNASGAWVATTVDSGGDVGLYTSIAIDTSGKTHISYFNYTNYYLKYATNVSGEWVTTTIDSDGKVGWFTSIALDTSDRVHISYASNIGYEDYASGDLMYATNASGAWVTTTVDSDGAVGFYTSIAVDTSDKAHISYYDYWPNGSLKYATNASGAWVTTTVDPGNWVGLYTSIALDKSGKAHISYFHSWEYAIKYATNTSGSWVTTMAVDGVGWADDETAYTSIAVDNAGHAHIGYFDHWDSDLKYATNASGSWGMATVDGTGAVGRYPSIALDTSGNVCISYYDGTNGNLKYAGSVRIPRLPKALTKSATNVRKTSVKLNATVNANSLTTKAWFEWGKISGGPYQNASPKRTIRGETDRNRGYNVQRLERKETYYYRVAAENEDGLSYGDEMSFETKR